MDHVVETKVLITNTMKSHLKNGEGDKGGSGSTTTGKLKKGMVVVLVLGGVYLLYGWLSWRKPPSRGRKKLQQKTRDVVSLAGNGEAQDPLVLELNDEPKKKRRQGQQQHEEEDPEGPGSPFGTPVKPRRLQRRKGTMLATEDDRRPVPMPPRRRGSNQTGGRMRNSELFYHILSVYQPGSRQQMPRGRQRRANSSVVTPPRSRVYPTRAEILLDDYDDTPIRRALHSRPARSYSTADIIQESGDEHEEDDAPQRRQRQQQYQHQRQGSLSLDPSPRAGSSAAFSYDSRMPPPTAQFYRRSSVSAAAPTRPPQAPHRGRSASVVHLGAHAPARRQRGL